MSDAAPSVPRGRHAPPLEVRLERQRARLFQAAARVFSRVGYAEASAEAISREAGMSKATFYEHFANKEECILALFDAAAEMVRGGVGQATLGDPDLEPAERITSGVQAFLAALQAYPDHAKTLLVEIIGAGPRAAERRDSVIQGFADLIDQQNAVAAERYGARRFASPDDTFAIIGAIVELASRQLRYGRPADIRDLEPVIERFINGVLDQGTPPRG
jgi:AcrR family transcriptional regulator